MKVTLYMRDGNHIAERHSGDPMTMEDGSVVLGETYMWIELAEDGRIEGVVETVRKMLLLPVVLEVCFRAKGGSLWYPSKQREAI